MNFLIESIKQLIKLIIRFVPQSVKRWMKKSVRSYLVWRVRRKKQIRVVFVINDLAVWKTEMLYKKMLEHHRFHPILAISPSREDATAHFKLMEYLKERNYDFVLLETNKTIIQQLPVDILIYEKPYDGCVSENHIARKHRMNLMVYVPYGFTNIMEPWSYSQPMYGYLWQWYQENEICAKATKSHLPYNSECVLTTGTPMMDELSKPKEAYINPWNDTRNRKRIIYAPHHTIGVHHLSGISYSTFIEYAAFMLELAKKYSKQTYWAFKPHPLLKDKLVEEWGKDRADCYYLAWEELENAQVETGQYIGLFKHSDAMIHDCSTFTQEYIYADKPVMYLLKDNHHTDNLNDFAKATFNLHVHGKTKQDIEQFVIDIINGKDIMKEERTSFYSNAMIPPHGKTACENIINAILGKEEYA